MINMPSHEERKLIEELDREADRPAGLILLVACMATGIALLVGAALTTLGGVGG